MADTPTRIPDFYTRRYDAPTETDRLICGECDHPQLIPHAELPPDGELAACPGCGLESRVPTLPSQAGMEEPVEPPPHSERS